MSTRLKRYSRRGWIKRSLTTATTLATAQATSGQEKISRRGPPKKVIVIGAGLSRLVAAHELSNAGHAVTILEARLRPGGRVLSLRDRFAEGLYAEAGATRIPDNHPLPIHCAKLFGLTLDPFRDHDKADIVHISGKRIRTIGAAPVDWPLQLSAEERTLGLIGMREKYILPVLSEIGDPTASTWPTDSLRKYDDLSWSEFLSSRGASPAAIAILNLGAIPPGDSLSALAMPAHTDMAESNAGVL